MSEEKKIKRELTKWSEIMIGQRFVVEDGIPEDYLVHYVKTNDAEATLLTYMWPTHQSLIVIAPHPESEYYTHVRAP